MSTPPPTAEAPAWPAPPDPPELPAGAVPASGRPAWHPATSVLAILAALAAAIGAGLIIGIVGVLFGADLEDPGPAVSLTATVAQDICFIGAAAIFASIKGGRVLPWQFGLRPTAWKSAVGWAALGLVAIFVISIAWGAITGHTKAEKLPDELGVESSTAALIATGLLVTVLAPIAEEILFRGYVFPALRNWKGTWPAVVGTGLLFSSLHIASSPLYALVPLAIFGGLLCLLYLRTRSLYPCIALHSVNNSIAFGAAPDVGWDWQILPAALGALALIGLAALAVRRAFGPAPAALSPV